MLLNCIRIQYLWLCLLFFCHAKGQAQPSGLENDQGKDLFQKAAEAFYTDLDSAIFYFRSAIPHFKKNQNWEGYLDCYLALTNCYHKQGDYDRYLENANIALRESLAYFGEDSRAYRSSVNNLAYAYVDRGNYSKAIDLLEQIVQQEMGTNKLDFAALLESLGHFYREQGDFDEAHYNYTRALHLIKDSKDASSQNLSSSFLKISKCLLDRGQLDSAGVLLKRALSLIPDHGREEKGTNLQEKIECLIQLAEISLMKNKLSEAEEYAQQAIRWSQGVYSFGLSKSYKIMGQVHLQKSNFREAIQAFNKAKQVNEVKYKSFTRHQSIGFCHEDLAKAYFAKGELEEALKQYQQSLFHLTLDFQSHSVYDLPDVEDFVRNVEVLDVLIGYAQGLKKRYETRNTELEDLQTAMKTCDLASQLIGLLRQQYQAQGSKFLLSERAQPLYELAIEIAIELNENTQDHFYLHEAFRFIEANKALVLLESIKENLAKGFGYLPDSLLQKEQALKLDVSFYEKNLAEETRKVGQDQLKIKRLNDKLFLLRRKYQELARNIERDFPKYHALKFQAEPVDIKQIQENLLDSESALLEFFVGERNIYLFFIGSSNLDVFSLEKEQFRTEDLLRLTSLIKKEPVASSFEADLQVFSDLAGKLYNVLLQPALEKERELKKLLIIPDGILCYLPFEVLLPDNKQTKDSFGRLPYLIQDYSIGYAYSAALLLRGYSTESRQGQLAFAGFAPSFLGASAIGSRSCNNGSLPALACNDYEVETIGELLNGDSKVGSHARKESLIEMAGRYKIIHLATHACIDRENPMLNKIFFAGDYLTYFDIQNLRLNADLAVLSACNTGSGKLQKGEGVLSLSRGFRLSGCKSSLMSLWAVNDCSTANLMVHFYENLKMGHSKDAALRKAKQKYLQLADKVSAHPYYWAAFVFFGNNDPIDFPGGRNNWIYFLAGGILIFITGWSIRKRHTKQ